MATTRDKNQPDPPANAGGARLTGGAAGEPGEARGPVTAVDRPGGDAPPQGVEPKMVSDAGRSTLPDVAGEPDTGASALENSGAAPYDFAHWMRAGGRGPSPAEADAGYGPKVVILKTGVSGPGGGPHGRGSVVSLSLILGPKLMRDDEKGPAAVQRYLGLGSFRPADAEEAKVSFVKLPETEMERAETADVERQKRIEAEERANRLEEELRLLREATGRGAPGGGSTDARGASIEDKSRQ